MKEELADRLGSIEKLPDFFLEILDWYGIDRGRVDIITAPTLVRRLVVAPQAEQIGGPGPEPWYLDMLDAHATARLGEIEQRGSLYVSRSTQPSRFAGESYLESVLVDSGFSVFYPETVPIEEKLRAYAGAESIVFAESSGLHSFQLMGRAFGDVTVMVRRQGRNIAQEELAPRARSLRYVDAVRGLLHGKGFEQHGGDGQAFWRALHLLDTEQLEAALPLASQWDRNAFDAAVEADVAEWLEAERTSVRWELPGSAEQVTSQLRALGFEHLAA